jgi:hypothetical protein
MGIARSRAAHLEDNLLIAVVVEIGKGDAMALVQFPRSRRHRDVDEFPRLPVPQQHARNERTV